MKILLVEDERTLSRVIEKGLKKLSYAVDAVYDGGEAVDTLAVNYYDLVVLDLNLPRLSGFEVLKTLRETDKKTKVLILSSKNQVEDKIQGLDLGANDYVEKPFDFLELEARIRNLLRWNFVQSDAVICIGRLEIDTRSKTVKADGIEINLTNKEYGILEYLAYHKDRFVPAEELIEHVWDSQADMFSNSFKVHVHSLKKKLGIESALETVRGKGYRLGDCL